MIEVTVMRYADYHTHTRFSDGSNTVREMAEAATEKNMYAIGFTDHAPMEFEEKYPIKQSWLGSSVNEISLLKKEYEGRLEIFAGLELDVNSDIDVSELDYLIEANHFIKVGDEYFPTDWTSKYIIDAADKCFGGDVYRYFEKYYEELSHAGDRGPATIGHFDVVAKHNETDRFFDEDDPRYLDAALSCVEVLAKKDVIFEVNTGAIFRGYRTKPYPAIPILKRMRELGCRVILGGDSHCVEALCHKFDEAMEYISQVGYTEIERYPLLRK
ncbi:MAG: histidinol-phosphatase HisJ family protein [Ruminococcaceae bacterium]|nr:histidinol-phosphatase HisJ family protein [Oscillospiraceae bacterium]